jgi:hypothetical protein
MRWPWEGAKESLSEELEAHVRMAAAERVARGEDPEQARAGALREFGNMALIEDVTREKWGWVWLENLLRDTRQALKQLRRAPAFTVTALLTLAFGIGANLGVFQLLYAVILADLPVSHPEELARVHAAVSPFDREWQVSYPAYLRLRAATPEIGLAARTNSTREGLQLSSGLEGKPNCEMVSDNFFSVLGIAPAAGRFLRRLKRRRGKGSGQRCCATTMRAICLARRNRRWDSTSISTAGTSW